MRIAFLVSPLLCLIALILVTSYSFAGQIIADWPDVIVCKKQVTGPKTFRSVVQIPLFVSITAVEESSTCINDKEIGRHYTAVYRSTHDHPVSMVEDEYQMRFCGVSVGEASAQLVLRDATDCQIGDTISQLEARGQTRRFGP
jgi:hypothetical protein